MKLKDLIEELNYTLLQGDENVIVDTLTSDSRKVCHNSAFVCIKGAVSDGHKYIPDVVSSGAAAIIVQSGSDLSLFKELLSKRKDVTVIMTDNTRFALAEMSAKYFGSPADKLFKIGITGTKGKTTTTYMIRNVLEACGIKTGLIGTIETIIGEKVTPAKNTTPESYEIHRSFKEMTDEGCKAVVMEVSSQGLKLDRTAGIMFDIGVFTNLSPDHIGPNEHESFEEYLECKSKLFRQCKVGIVNSDDKYTEQIIKAATCKIETYGVKKDADLKAQNVQIYHERGKIGLSYDCLGLMDIHVELGMPGEFSVYNSLCAIAVTRHFNVDKSVLSDTLKTVKVKGRIEIVKVSDKFTLLIDYAHNAMALESILNTLKQYNPHRLVCLFGCGGNRSRDRRFQMGEVSGRLADLTVITSDNPRFEEPDAIIDDIKTGVCRTNGRYVDITDRKEAIKYVIKNAEPGDIIVLAGKGHEDYQEIRGVKYPMDERVLIDESVNELKSEGWEP